MRVEKSLEKQPMSKCKEEQHIFKPVNEFETFVAEQLKQNELGKEKVDSLKKENKRLKHLLEGVARDNLSLQATVNGFNESWADMLLALDALRADRTCVESMDEWREQEFLDFVHVERIEFISMLVKQREYFEELHSQQRSIIDATCVVESTLRPAILNEEHHALASIQRARKKLKDSDRIHRRRGQRRSPQENVSLDLQSQRIDDNNSGSCPHRTVSLEAASRDIAISASETKATTARSQGTSTYSLYHKKPTIAVHCFPKCPTSRKQLKASSPSKGSSITEAIKEEKTCSKQERLTKSPGQHIEGIERSATDSNARTGYCPEAVPTLRAHSCPSRFSANNRSCASSCSLSTKQSRGEHARNQLYGKAEHQRKRAAVRRQDFVKLEAVGHLLMTGM